MAFLSWVNVQGGVWTTLYSGPSFAIGGVQLLEFTASTPTQNAYSVNFRVFRYSPVPPFRYSISNTRTAIRQDAYLPASGTSNLFYLPAVSGSPWTHITILCDVSCRAHVLF
jgi:hypothetical protein